jgi:uncharacterized cupin superfamily protein
VAVGRGQDGRSLGARGAVGALAFREAAGRPPNIVHLEDAEGEEDEDGTWKGLAASAGSRDTGLNWIRLAPGRAAAQPHCHSEEEEVFVILDGGGTLELWPSPVMEARGGRREHVPVTAGTVVARPPATRVAHTFRAGPGGMTMLVYGTRRPNDICYYPRSRKIYWRGVGLIGRVESLDYEDGEPPN